MINTGELHQIASQIFKDATEVTREIFELIRCDEHWLAGEMSEPNRWYVMALVGVLQPSPRLPLASRNVLWYALPVLGWTKAEVDTLLLGKDLTSLPRSDPNPLFGQTFTGLYQYGGGWLNQAALESLLNKLGNVEDAFRVVSNELSDAVRFYSQLVKGDSSTLLNSAYHDAVEMLRAPLEQGRALFITSD